MNLRQAGMVIGNYRVVGTLGWGGFGAVYEAEALGAWGLIAAGQHVALKETFEPASVRQFRREFAVLRGLTYPALPCYYQFFEQGDTGYLVMEFVPGQNLEDVLAAHPRG